MLLAADKEWLDARLAECQAAAAMDRVDDGFIRRMEAGMVVPRADEEGITTQSHIRGPPKRPNAPTAPARACESQSMMRRSVARTRGDPARAEARSP